MKEKYTNDAVSLLWGLKEIKDIEVMAVICQQICFGNREQMIKKARELFDEMNGKPYEYIQIGKYYKYQNSQECHYRMLKKNDFSMLCQRLYEIYQCYGSLEKAIIKQMTIADNHVDAFCQLFEGIAGIPTNYKKSYCGRVNLMFRWLVCKDDVNVGIWSKIKPQDLYTPIDTHVAKVAKEKGLLIRKTEDWKAVIELTNKCKERYPNNPTCTDFILFNEDIEKNKSQISTNNQKTINLAPNKPSSLLSHFKDKRTAAIQAYINLSKNDPALLAFHTFGTLYSIEVLRMAMLRLLPTIQSEDKLYRQMVKAKCSKVLAIWNTYYNNILKYCYNNDQEYVREKIKDIEVDITKMFFSIKNYFDKYKERFASSLSIVMVCRGLADLICSQFEKRLEHLRTIEKNIEFAPFMIPTIIRKPLLELCDSILAFNRNDLVINLNADSTIMLAARVIDTKINDYSRIADIIMNIEKHRIENEKTRR